MFPWAAKKNSAIMFDVGTTSIRACQLSRRGQTLELRDHLQLALRADDDNDHAANPDCERLARTLVQARFAGRGVGLVLTPPAVQFHTLEVPTGLLKNSEDAIHKALAWEIARETRTEAAQWEVRYWPFPPGHRPGRNVMTVAISSPLVREWVARFNRHGLHLCRVTASPCSLARVAACTCPPQEEDVWGVLDVGHRRSVLTVLVATRPVYVRVVAGGARDWVQRIARAFDTTPDEARQIMQQHGLRPARDASEATGENPTPGNLSGVLFSTLRPALDDLVREINRCFLYVLESYPNLSVARLFTAGGGSALAGLTEYLELQLDLPAQRLTCTPTPSAAAGPTLAVPSLPPESAASLGGSLLDVEAPSCNR